MDYLHVQTDNLWYNNYLPTGGLWNLYVTDEESVNLQSFKLFIMLMFLRNIIHVQCISGVHTGVSPEIAHSRPQITLQTCNISATKDGCQIFAFSYHFGYQFGLRE